MTDKSTTAEVQHCTLEDIGMEITGADAPPIVGLLNDYLSAFAKPVFRETPGLLYGAFNCLKCDSPLTGVVGTFQ